MRLHGTGVLGPWADSTRPSRPCTVFFRTMNAVTVRADASHLNGI